MASNLSKKFEEVVKASDRFTSEWSNTLGSFNPNSPSSQRDKDILVMRFEGLKEAVEKLGDALEETKVSQD